jgi:phosphoribosylaminoimidazole-succinocarboxamide synthase
MSTAVILEALADGLDAMATTIRQRAALLSAGSRSTAATPAGAVDRARAMHPMLGKRQAEVIALLEEAGPDGTNAGAISKAMGYDQPNVYLALQALSDLDFVQKDPTTSPHTYRLAPILLVPRIASGKVREMFDAGEHMLMVATDRISVFDVVLPTPIPGKGAVLAGLSQFWFDRTKDIVANHLVGWRLSDLPDGMRSSELAGRAQLVRKAEMIPLECVVRGYIAGTAWKDYRRTGEVCGHKLPDGLLEAQQLPEPLFTPSTKALTGHDENISVAQAKQVVGDAALVDRIADVSIRLYEFARDFAAARGIILADTKYEFGLVDGELTLCDELFTPDSSRYWPADQWEPGTNPPSFDKQFVRDYAETVNWNKQYPGPALPDDVVAGTTARYREAYERVTGASFDSYMKDAAS